MTQEDKELLLKDLSARWLYGVIVKYMSRESEGDVKLGYGNIGYIFQLGNGWWKECKPYLRPMPSMTEEELEEFHNYTNVDPISWLHCAIDWLNSKHFDYRGLIEKGLAIEVNEENNPYKVRW